MKVLVLGSGVIGVTTAYYLAKAGHEVTVVDRQAAAGAGDQLRQCRRGLARLRLALGRPRHADQGDQVAADAARPAGDPADARSGDVAVAASRCCATAPRSATRSTRAAWCRSPNTAATACASCAPTTGIAYDERSQGTLQLFRTQKQLDGTADDIAVLKQYGVPYEVLDRDGCIGGRAGAGRGARQVRRRPAAARRRDRRLLHVHRSAWPRSRRAARRPVPLRHARSSG